MLGESGKLEMRTKLQAVILNEGVRERKVRLRVKYLLSRTLLYDKILEAVWSYVDDGWK